MFKIKIVCSKYINPKTCELKTTISKHHYTQRCAQIILYYLEIYRIIGLNEYLDIDIKFKKTYQIGTQIITNLFY